MAHDLVRAEPDRPEPVPGCLFRDEPLGREPRRDLLRPHRWRPDLARLDAPHPGGHAQRSGRARLPPQRLGPLRRTGAAGRRLPRLRDLRAAVSVVDGRVHHGGTERTMDEYWPSGDADTFTSPPDEETETE